MINFIDTTLRDAHQSLMATRLRTDDAVLLAEKLDKAGFYSLEVWGGATFDADLRFLKEDPWLRVKRISQVATKSKKQMLLRGVSLVGYEPYPKDVIKEFIHLAHRDGIDIFRIFDALNDINNLAFPIKEAKRTGAIVQGAITYTISPIHTIDYYIHLAENIASLEVDIITIKDMAGLLDPLTAEELVSRIKEEIKLPIGVHTHDSMGLSTATYYASANAGADFIDTSVYPLAYGAAQPAIQSVYYALPKEKRAEINLSIVNEVSSKLKELLSIKYTREFNPHLQVPDPQALVHQIPGGMISNLLYQLKEMDQLDKLDEVLEEVPKIRKELGWPPLVTPISQMVGAQAVLNVIAGERYSLLVKELKAYIKGKYGKPPGEIDSELRKRVEMEEEPEMKKLSLKECEERLRSILHTYINEDVLTYCMFPEEAEDFFKTSMKLRTS
ncbi:MAG: pyruvate carboxylase subunit B [Fervidicoccaceae archaeon]